MSEYSQLQRLFSKKPSSKNISEIKQLQSFIQNYPDDTLKPNLYKLLRDHKQYRKVNGDGNCFYRAIMFLYLRQANLTNYQALFPTADLLKCRNLPFKVSKNLTSENLLSYLWQTQLINLAEESPKSREKYLLEMINKSSVIDSILIAYLRVLNYDYLLVVKQELQPYTEGGIKNDIERVLIFGKESEGVELYTLSKILNIAIEIIMVHQQNLTTVKYNQEAKRMNIKLFYRPGHYDIICDRNQNPINSNKVEKPTFTQFYYKNKSPNANISDFNTLQKTNQTNSSSKIISVSKPSEIRLLSYANQNTGESNQKELKTMKQFKQNLSNGRQSQVSRLSKQSLIQDNRTRSIIKETQKKGSDDNTKNKFQNFKSNYEDKKAQTQRQRILTEGIICLIGVLALIAGVLSL